MSLDRKFNEDSKYVLKIVIFLLQVGFIGYFVPDCFSKCVSGSSNFDPFFHPDFTVIRKFNGKQIFSYFKWLLLAILSLTVLSNCVSGSSNFAPFSPLLLVLKQYRSRTRSNNIDHINNLFGTTILMF